MQAESLRTAPDTTASTATAPTPFIPPSNGGYMQVAYLVAGVIYLAYALSLFSRARAERK